MKHAIAFTQLVQPRPSSITCGLHLSKTSFLVNSTCPHGGVRDARRRQHQYTYPLRRCSIHISSVTQMSVQTSSHSSDIQSPSPPPSLPSSTATYVDPQTGSTVHIIGCVHGSFVSAEDVRRVLSFSDPDRIVLELCEARFSSLRKSILRTSPEKKLSLHLSGTDENRKGRTFKEIARTFRGAPQAILALLLDGAYKLQVLSGLDPGQEFANPIRNYPVAKLVCGDDPASTTVNRMYRVFISPLTSMRVSVDAFTAMFRRVVLPPKGGINLFRVLLEPMRLQELGRLLLAASAVGMVLFAFGSATAVAIDATPFVVPQNFHSALSTVDLAVQSATSLYLLVSILHFLKVLIIDRDVVLADSIRSAMTKSENEKQQAVKICVVVGLLHVNGVLQELNEGACSTSEPGQP